LGIDSINNQAHVFGKEICAKFLSEAKIEIRYDVDGNVSKVAEACFEHKGLYAFVLSRAGDTYIPYVGKAEKGGRLREHLTGKNKDGTPLADSVGTKYKNIQSAISAGYTVYLSLFSDPSFTKSSLAFMEAECIDQCKAQLLSFEGVDTWNIRTG
jgi:hypothetical protein